MEEGVSDSVFIKPGIVEVLLFFLIGSSILVVVVSTRASLLGAVVATTSKVTTETAGNIPSYRISKSISGAACDFNSIISPFGWAGVVLIDLFFFRRELGGARTAISATAGNCGASNILDTTASDACDDGRLREGENAASSPIWDVDNTAKDVTARTTHRRRRRCLIELSPPFAALLIVLINLTGTMNMTSPHLKTLFVAGLHVRSQ